MSSYLPASYFTDLNAGNPDQYSSSGNGGVSTNFLPTQCGTSGAVTGTDQYARSSAQLGHYMSAAYSRFPGFDRDNSGLAGTSVAGSAPPGPGHMMTSSQPDDFAHSYANCAAQAAAAAHYNHLSPSGYQPQHPGMAAGFPMSGPQNVHPGFGPPLFPWMRPQFSEEI